jgi:adenine deaminase
MPTLLIHRARCIATMDDAQTELQNASLLIRDGRIERLIPATENTDALLTQVDEVIDARHHVVVPGLIMGLIVALFQAATQRSEERRVGKECTLLCR